MLSFTNKIAVCGTLDSESCVSQYLRGRLYCRERLFEAALFKSIKKKVAIYRTMCYNVIMKSITIYEIRKKTKLSQSQFARKFHLTTRVVQSWEQGQRNTPEHILYMIQRILELESANSR